MLRNLLTLGNFGNDLHQRSYRLLVSHHHVATTLCLHCPVPARGNGVCAPIRSHWRQSASGRLSSTAYRLGRWVGSGLELTTEAKFYPPPHFQQYKRFATTMAQHPL